LVNSQTYNSHVSKYNNLDRIIGENIPEDSTLLKFKNTYGGSFGDGDLFAEIKLSKDGIQKFIDKTKNNKSWSHLPLSNDINFIIYGYRNETTLNNNIPNNIDNGIYYVKDRFSGTPEENKSNILRRNSFDVTIAILDFDKNILYIYKLDT
jgi:hypothetical protein